VRRLKGLLGVEKPSDKAKGDIESTKKPGEGEALHGPVDFLGPPNLQVNVSSGHSSQRWKGTELFLAACAAILLQTGLVVIAVITVYHEPTRELIRFEPKIYGLPCYLGGSVGLFVGMVICSLAVERSTVEFIWERSPSWEPEGGSDISSTGSEKSSTELIRTRRENGSSIASHTSGPEEKNQNLAHARLFWLQKSQTVSDQSFDSYVILGGSKRYVLTSSREDEVIESRKSNQNSDRGNGRTLMKSASHLSDVDDDHAHVGVTIPRKFHVWLTTLYRPK
jgi:hypothetical protein